MSVVQKASFLPVTALQFVKVEDEEFLVAGEGSSLKTFSKNGQLLCTVEALPFRVVHGIKPFLHNDAVLLLVFGQKSFRVVEILKGGGAGLQCTCDAAELADWILDACWLAWKDSDNHHLVFLTAHNVLVCRTAVKGMLTTLHYHSEINCILYSGLIAGSGLGELTIASGTVFNEILLWHVADVSPRQTSPASVRVSFTGHKGVIFSVKANSQFSNLVSASDDRTVRVWTIPDDWRSQKRVLKSECLLVLYGHTARVWMAMLLPTAILSIGEDATCRVWSYGGETLKTYKGHRGKSIWSMAVDHKNEILATGGGDCSIRVQSLKEPSKPSVCHSWLPRRHVEDSVTATPRSVFLLGQTAICLTDQGSLFAGQCHPGTGEVVWSEVSHDPQFSGFAIGALSPYGSRILALGNIHGSIKLMKLNKNGTVLKSASIQPYSGKVFSLNWTLSQGFTDSSELLFSCGPDGIIIGWEVKMDDNLVAERLATLTLPASKHRWLKTVSILTHLPPSSPSPPPLLLLGDRKGSLHLYRLEEGVHKAHQTLPGCHGTNGVTYSCSHGSAIYTCGRDGLCRKFQLSYTGGIGELVELTKFKLVKGLEWIEMVHFTETGDMLVLGFHGANLVLHSTAQNRRLLDVPCGGGHRSFAVSSLQDMLAQKKVTMLFVKKAEVVYREIELKEYFTKSLFQPAFVGLEASSMVIVRNESGNALVAVGSEDCSICLLKVHSNVENLSDCLEVRHTLQGHISSVKALTSSSSSARTLLFSGGARARLKVWSVEEDEALHFETEISVHEDLNVRAKRKQRAKFKPLDPDVTPECRIMSLASFPLHKLYSSPSLRLHESYYVAAGCSDALIRHYIYDARDRHFHPLPSLKMSKRCVITIELFLRPRTFSGGDVEHSGANHHPILCSTSTDGVIALWNVLPAVTEYIKQSEDGEEVRTRALEVARFRAHQSGINGLAVQTCYSVTEEVLHAVASGGEDNALAVTYLSSVDTQGGLSMQVAKEHTQPSAHSSTITGVCFIGDGLVASTSIDQRLNIWKVSMAGGIQLMSSHTHDVADPSSLVAYSSRRLGGTLAIFCGVGLQCYLYKDGCLENQTLV